MDAIYIFTERGRTQYAYSQYGGNYATPLVRYSESCCASFDVEREPLDIIMDLNYNGEYAPQERNGNKVFNRLDDSKMTDETAYMLMHSGVVGAVIHLNTDKNIVKYSFNNTFGKQDYVLDIDEAAIALNTAAYELEQQHKKWSIKELSEDCLDRCFEILQHDGKSKDYVMDIVVVEPNTPAYSKRLDVSDGKLQAMQAAVQGYIEPIYSLEEQGIYVYGNEEARVMEQAPNRKVEGEQAICGTFFICGADKDTNSVSLTPEQTQKYIEKYKVPDRFTEQEIAAAHRCEIVFIPMDYPTPPKQTEKQEQTIKPKQQSMEFKI